MFKASIKQRDLADSFAMYLIWEAFTGIDGMDVISGVAHAYMGVGKWGGMVDGGKKNPVSEKHLCSFSHSPNSKMWRCSASAKLCKSRLDHLFSFYHCIHECIYDIEQ